ncbi:inclusion body family protein [Vitiosangium sp. GDMCC 1.1324]|uniref:inclusion body family protein n=1 Tax=Vitiosangium sp. (strain GDMCC 1.1324) TaxID=2138576 RepID=UPI000D37DADA|nr:inclusion body family protein [Vitiosangium sp. GDMCC 1.1324]PTL80270.1 hypothetical protein DAT35_30235 [Vitiosangium sp. GDMCC 1.1324]
MSETENLIDILVVIDAESVMQQFTPSSDAGKPTSIGSNPNLIYMFVKWDEVISGDASSGLSVSVSPNNIIRWRGTSLALNTHYSVVLTACEFTQGQNLISSPAPITPSVSVPLPQLNGNVVVTNPLPLQNIQDFYFQSVALDTGKVTYTFSFAVTNNDGNVLGYFKWDPSLVVS